mgnify:CR=1 FL=1
MKVNIIDDNNIIVFLNKFNIKNIDFSNRENIEKNFRNIFLKLKHIYKLDIKGYYDIKIYIDKYYGAVLEIEHDDIEYIDYFDSQIDMRVNVIKDNEFLYKIDDIFLNDRIINKIDIYNFKEEYYIKIKKELNNYDMAYILENSNLIYDNITFDILKLGNKILIKDLVN